MTDALVAETARRRKGAQHLRWPCWAPMWSLPSDEVQRSANAADFKSQLAVCKALSAGCIGTETTGMHKQPAGTTRERAQYMLCKSLETILPEAERLGVTVAIEPVLATAPTPRRQRGTSWI